MRLIRWLIIASPVVSLFVSCGDEEGPGPTPNPESVWDIAYAAIMEMRDEGVCDLWFRGNNEGWACVGKQVLHFDGAVWSVLHEFPSGFATQVCGLAADDVWAAVSDDGDAYYPNITATPDGRLIVAWEDARDGEGTDIYYGIFNGARWEHRGQAVSRGVSKDKDEQVARELDRINRASGRLAAVGKLMAAAGGAGAEAVTGTVVREVGELVKYEAAAAQEAAMNADDALRRIVPKNP